MTQGVDYNKVERKHNSGKKQEAEEPKDRVKLDAVIKPAIPHKKGLTQRLVSAVIGPRGAKGIGKYVGKEIIVPAVKDIIYNGFISGLGIAVYGDEGRRKNSKPNGGWNNPNNGYSRQARPNNNSTRYDAAYNNKPRVIDAPTESMYDATEYIISDRQDAMRVLDALGQQIDQFGSASIADYYDLIGVATNYTDYQYGWDDISMARIRSTRGGVIIDLPQSEVIR